MYTMYNRRGELLGSILDHGLLASRGEQPLPCSIYSQIANGDYTNSTQCYIMHHMEEVVKTTCNEILERSMKLLRQNETQYKEYLISSTYQARLISIFQALNDKLPNIDFTMVIEDLENLAEVEDYVLKD